MYSRCSFVVYHPMKIGIKLISAGKIQALPSIHPTVLCFIITVYSSGLTMA